MKKGPPKEQGQAREKDILYILWKLIKGHKNTKRNHVRFICHPCAFCPDSLCTLLHVLLPFMEALGHPQSGVFRVVFPGDSWYVNVQAGF